MRRWTGAVAAGGLAAFGAMAWPVAHDRVLPFDLPVRAAIHAWTFPALTVAMRLISALGLGYFLVPLAILLVARWIKRREVLPAYLLAAAALSAELASESLKMLFARPRPEVFFGLTPAENFSFPSGHAFVPAVYFGILAVLLRAGPRWRAAVAVLALCIGYSRVYLGYHYPSDVVAGWGLALVWLAFWTAIAARRLP